MGLLDDAIREHLELKRRGGADPNAVARAEHEALAPVFPDEAEVLDGHGDDPPAGSPVADSGLDVDEHVEEHRHGAHQLADLSAMSQETAELDMRAVMEEDPDAAEDRDAADGAPPVDPAMDAPAAPAYAGEPSEEDPLEWEAPSDGQDSESSPRDAPGQERLSFE
jgi:hypothetical protein